jgi:medium-chain acyl-[acyl-carrier-protein] hydrolase
MRERPFTRLTALVEHVTDAVRPHLDRPFVLFGHSMGGLVAFELARALRRTGEPMPAELCVSAVAAAHISRDGPPVHRLPDGELIDRIRRLNGTPAQILESDLLALMLPVLRADFEVVETYVHQPAAPLDCPLVALGGLRDRVVPHAHLEQWRLHTRGDFALALVPGDHFFLNQPAFLPVLLDHLQRVIAPHAGEAGRSSAS